MKTGPKRRRKSAPAGGGSEKPGGDLEGLLPALGALVEWFEAARIRGVVIGGVAASALSRARFTRDVDALVIVDDDAWTNILASATAFGITPRIDDPLTFARKYRVLLLKHDPSRVEVDVSLGALPFEHDVVARATAVRVGRLRVPLPSPEDLIILKALAHRPQDWLDIEAVIASTSKLDIARIRRHVKEFAELLDEPAILTAVERRLEEGANQRRHARGRHH